MAKKRGKKESRIKNLIKKTLSKKEIKQKKKLDGYDKKAKQLKYLDHHSRTHLTIGQKAADSITKWAGSWLFIISFLIFLVFWMAMNVFMWIREWDPYPFILLNLVLSCIAAIQAPIILMSQNREVERDRIKAERDYLINRKAEKEIKNIQADLKKLLRGK